MNKLDYLNQLESILKKQHMSKADIDDIIRDYAEFFEEGRRQGQSDGEISAKLGSPELVAQQILEENGHSVAVAPVAPKAEFKMPKFELPKFERKEKEPKEKIPRENSGCLPAFLKGTAKLAILCVVAPILALVFGCVAVGIGAAFIGLICAVFAIIVGFFAAAIAAHFLTLPVTLFAITACIALLALAICLGALLTMLLVWCGKICIDILRILFGFKKEEQPVIPKEIIEQEESIVKEEDGELYE